MRDDLSPRRRALREVALAPALFVVLAAVVLVSLLVGVGPAGSSALSVKNGKFAFVGSSPANIWVMNANGSGRKVLTPHYRFASIERADSEPDWSPNGTEIAFTRSRQTTGLHGAPEPVTEIDVMNADGSSQTRLTRTTKNDHSPTWSPDGKKIAFVRDRILSKTPGSTPFPYGEVWVMKANGSGQTRLTQVALDVCNRNTLTGEGENLDASQPAWSPDGTKIAFTGIKPAYPCSTEIYVMNADGSGQTRLTNNPADDYGPNWQPIPVPAQTKIDKAKINRKQGKARFRFSASGPNPATGFECELKRPKRKHHHSRSRRLGPSRVDFRGAKFRPCISAKTYKHLRPGRYTFLVRAIDVAGPDPTPAKRRFRITG